MHGLVSLRIQDTGYRIQDRGYRVQDTGYRVRDIQVLFTRRDRIKESYSLEDTEYRSPIHSQRKDTGVQFTRRYRIQDSYSLEETGYRSYGIMDYGIMTKIL